MIKKIRLKFGPTVDDSKLEFEPSAITVFVGPNNSGKSKAIAEISHQCTHGTAIFSDVILDELWFSDKSEAEAGELLQKLSTKPPINVLSLDQFAYISTRNGIVQIDKNLFLASQIDPNRAGLRQYFASYYSLFRTLALSGRLRTTLTNAQTLGDLGEPAVTTFQRLFRSDDLRKNYRQLVHKSLGVYPVLDPTFGGELRMRLSTVEPSSSEVERGLTQHSIDFHRMAQLMEDASDGARAFTGLLAETMAGDPQILLVDEPEAFLHPSLAFNLGRELGYSLSGTTKQLFVSTHSSQFVMGCIQSGAKINVIRLTYRDGVPTARILPSDEIVRIMRNPLLRSIGVISALFYESVVVTEADSDRAFYQEINERLLRVGRGIPNCIFLNAQNKDTIPFIVRPLRSLGIPTAAIYDLDIVKNQGAVAIRVLEAAGIPELQHDSMSMLRASVLTALNNADATWKRSGGIKLLPVDQKAAAENYLAQLSTYGTFVVGRGELEGWLPALGVMGQKSGWLIRIFEAMGEDPEQPEYISPAADDVWQFLDEVAAWLLDPNRKGIAA